MKSKNILLELLPQKFYGEQYYDKDMRYELFDVPGAGNIMLSESCHNSTGRVVGFSFGVEWSESKYLGGVLGRDEAMRMARFILDKCSQTDETMEEEYIRLQQEMNDCLKHLKNK